MARQYSKAAGKSVEKAMHEKKRALCVLGREAKGAR